MIYRITKSIQSVAIVTKEIEAPDMVTAMLAADSLPEPKDFVAQYPSVEARETE